MNPLSGHNPGDIQAAGSPLPAPPPATESSNRSDPAAAPHGATCRVARVYPWLLLASTGVAGLFCLMYITKPVMLASLGPVPGYSNAPVPAKQSPPDASLVLSQDRSPAGGQTVQAAAIDPGDAVAQSGQATAFEQTNHRVQHLLTAEAPGGQVAKIDIEVPVLYRSRNLRWTPTEVADARALLSRLSNYQEKCQTLRAEGAELLDAWNRLVERSIPVNELRADSPTLPVNQQDAADAPRPAGLDTSELIKIQAPGK